MYSRTVHQLLHIQTTTYFDEWQMTSLNKMERVEEWIACNDNQFFFPRNPTVSGKTSTAVDRYVR